MIKMIKNRCFLIFNLIILLAVGFLAIAISAPVSGGSNYSENLGGEKNQPGGVFLRIGQLLVEDKDKIKNIDFAHPAGFIQSSESLGLKSQSPQASFENKQLSRFPLLEAWRQEIEGKIFGLANLRELIVLTTDEGQVYLIDSKNGEVIKIIKFPGGFVFPPVVSSGSESIWLFGQDKIYCLVKSGKLQLEIKNLGKIIYSPMAEDQQVFLVFNDQVMMAVEASSGLLFWKLELPGKPRLPPFISGSSVFIPLQDNMFLRIDKATGKKLAEYQFKEPIDAFYLVEERYLVVGSESGDVVSFDLKNKKIRWRVSLGHQKIAWLVSQGKWLYVATTNGLLEALKISGGDLIWWESIPGKISFKPVFFHQEIYVLSGSQTLTGFDLKSGQVTSEINLPGEIRAGVLATEERIVTGCYDFKENKSYLYGWKKEPQLVIEPSEPSPQPIGTSIVFKAQAVGFNHPRYEFYLRLENGPEKLMRKASNKNTWTWLPSKEGNYTVIVKAFDKKLTRVVELRYNITSLSKEKGNERSEK
ncbi:MAG: hypothetical protein C0168_03765 [Candidatus Aminicenantes bacterium]|nr:MAG: hypothetical protein C0168_03765 [Candidatus Aminicenantes bacterium]